jgi:hypothetical protein
MSFLFDGPSYEEQQELCRKLNAERKAQRRKMMEPQLNTSWEHVDNSRGFTSGFGVCTVSTWRLKIAGGGFIR